MAHIRIQNIRSIHNQFVSEALLWEGQSTSLQTYTFKQGLFHALQCGRRREIEALLVHFPYFIARLKKLQNSGILGVVIDMLCIQTLGATQRYFSSWMDFYLDSLLLLKSSESSWGVEKVALQLAIERGEDNWVTKQAEAWLQKGGCDWLWIRRVHRPSISIKKPCIHSYAVDDELGLHIKEERTFFCYPWFLTWKECSIQLWYAYSDEPYKDYSFHQASIMRIHRIDEDTLVSVDRSGAQFLWTLHKGMPTPKGWSEEPLPTHSDAQTATSTAPSLTRIVLKDLRACLVKEDLFNWEPEVLFRLADKRHLLFGDDGALGLIDGKNITVYEDEYLKYNVAPTAVYTLQDGSYISVHRSTPFSFCHWCFPPIDAQEPKINLLGVYHHEEDMSEGFIDLGEKGYLSFVGALGSQGSDCLYIRENMAIKMVRNRENNNEEVFVSQFPQDIILLTDTLLLTRGDRYSHIWDLDILYSNARLGKEDEPGVYIHSGEITITEGLAQETTKHRQALLTQFRKQALQAKDYISHHDPAHKIAQGDILLLTQPDSGLALELTSLNVVHEDLAKGLYTPKEWEHKSNRLAGYHPNRPSKLYPIKTLRRNLPKEREEESSYLNAVERCIQLLPFGAHTSSGQILYWYTDRDWRPRHLFATGKIVLTQSDALQIVQIYQGNTPISFAQLQSNLHHTQLEHLNKARMSSPPRRSKRAFGPEELEKYRSLMGSIPLINNANFQEDIEEIHHALFLTKLPLQLYQRWADFEFEYDEHWMGYSCLCFKALFQEIREKVPYNTIKKHPLFRDLYFPDYIIDVALTQLFQLRSDYEDYLRVCTSLANRLNVPLQELADIFDEVREKKEGAQKILDSHNLSVEQWGELDISYQATLKTRADIEQVLGIPQEIFSRFFTLIERIQSKSPDPFVLSEFYTYTKPAHIDHYTALFKPLIAVYKMYFTESISIDFGDFDFEFVLTDLFRHFYNKYTKDKGCSCVMYLCGTALRNLAKWMEHHEKKVLAAIEKQKEMLSGMHSLTPRQENEMRFLYQLPQNSYQEHVNISIDTLRALQNYSFKTHCVEEEESSYSSDIFALEDIPTHQLSCGMQYRQLRQELAIHQPQAREDIQDQYLDELDIFSQRSCEKLENIGISTLTELLTVPLDYILSSVTGLRTSELLEVYQRFGVGVESVIEPSYLYPADKQFYIDHLHRPVSSLDVPDYDAFEACNIYLVLDLVLKTPLELHPFFLRNRHLYTISKKMNELGLGLHISKQSIARLFSTQETSPPIHKPSYAQAIPEYFQHCEVKLYPKDHNEWLFVGGSAVCHHHRDQQAPITSFVNDNRIISGSLMTQHGLLIWEGLELGSYEGTSDCRLILNPLQAHKKIVFVGHQHAIVGAVELGSEHILSWALDGTWRIWNSKGQEEKKYSCAEEVERLIPLHDGHHLSLCKKGSERHVLRLWKEGGDALIMLDVQKPIVGQIFDIHKQNDGVLVLGSECKLSITHTNHTLCIQEWNPLHVDHSDRVFRGAGCDIVMGKRGDMRLLLEHDSLQREGIDLKGHLLCVTGIHQRGEHILSYSNDGDIRLWSQKGVCRAIFSGHCHAVEGLAFLSERDFMSWSNDEILFWSLPQQPYPR